MTSKRGPESSYARPDVLADDARFPKGFTGDHKAWLKTAITPPALNLLQAALPPSGPVVSQILAARQKPLADPVFSLL